MVEPRGQSWNIYLQILCYMKKTKSKKKKGKKKKVVEPLLSNLCCLQKTEMAT